MTAAISARKAISLQRPVLVTGALVLIVLSMIMPMPPRMLDIGIAFSIATAMLIFVMAALVDKPTDFEAFPVLLLVSLVVRLSLSVSSTRLILTQGHTGTHAAGEVINGFANFVAGGSLLVGLTVFGVISAVNFMVITKGAGRMAEVAARFALDSLPGKQLAIDGDLNSGAITHEEAKVRRQQEQREINFFGSLDGASKFVKGDAIAGIVIIFINLLVGMAVGIFVHGMPAGEAMHSYSQLTIGDGLVTQIPALITSMGAALLLARSGANSTTDDMLTGQIARNWRASAVVSLAMASFALVPGIPPMLFLFLASIFGFMAWRAWKNPPEEAAAETVPDLPVVARPHKIGDDLDIDEISVEIGTDLVSSAMDEGRGLGARILNLRKHIARSYGVILPEVRITDSATQKGNEYIIRIQGVVRGRGELHPHQLMALGDSDGLRNLGGPQIREPVYGSPAKWVNENRREEIALLGLTAVSPIEVLSTHLMEVVKSNLSALMTLTAMQRMITELKELSDENRARNYQRYFENMMPEKVTPELLLAVLRQMLDEGLSVRNLTLIVDAAYEARNSGSPELIYEGVRKRLRAQITQAYADQDGTLKIVQLHPSWEAQFAAGDGAPGRPADGVIATGLARKLVEATKQTLAIADPTATAVIATPDHRRRQVREILGSHGIDTPVMGLEEIDPAAQLRLVGTIEAAG